MAATESPAAGSERKVSSPAGPIAPATAPPQAPGAWMDEPWETRRVRERTLLAHAIMEKREVVDLAEAYRLAAAERPHLLRRSELTSLVLEIAVADRISPAPDLGASDREYVAEAYRDAAVLVAFARDVECGQGGEKARTVGGGETKFTSADRLRGAIDALRKVLTPDDLLRRNADELAVVVYEELAGLFRFARRRRRAWKTKAGKTWSAHHVAEFERRLLLDVVLLVMHFGITLDDADRTAVLDTARPMLDGGQRIMPSEAARNLTARFLFARGLPVADDTVREGARDRLRKQGVSVGDLDLGLKRKGPPLVMRKPRKQ